MTDFLTHQQRVLEVSAQFGALQSAADRARLEWQKLQAQADARRNEWQVLVMNAPTDAGVLR